MPIVFPEAIHHHLSSSKSSAVILCQNLPTSAMEVLSTYLIDPFLAVSTTLLSALPVKTTLFHKDRGYVRTMVRSPAIYELVRLGAVILHRKCS